MLSRKSVLRNAAGFEKGGKLIVWYMEAPTKELRDISDSIETMRDNSHTRILSRDEFEALFKESFELQFEETIFVPVNIQKRMDLTNTPENIHREIISKMENDLNGGDNTGFFPYIQDGEIYFDHKWLLSIGKKKTNHRFSYY